MQENKRGYLNGQFRLFHLADRELMRFEPHCHEFYKILVHIAGNTIYTIGDNIYSLTPGDILFIPKYQMHYTEIGESLYERYILWISEECLNKQSGSTSLQRCFETASESGTYVFHPEPALFQAHLSLLKRLEHSLKSPEFGAELYAETYIMQFLIEMNRLSLSKTAVVNAVRPAFSAHIEEAVIYIAGHLGEDLCVETLASRLYISPSYLMHRFRQDTGLTLHQYILQKRLFAVVQELGQEYSISETARLCGFKDYSTFFRAFKKFFGKTPQEFVKSGKRSLQEQMPRE